VCPRAREGSRHCHSVDPLMPGIRHDDRRSQAQSIWRLNSMVLKKTLLIAATTASLGLAGTNAAKADWDHDHGGYGDHDGGYGDHGGYGGRYFGGHGDWHQYGWFDGYRRWHFFPGFYGVPPVYYEPGPGYDAPPPPAYYAPPPEYYAPPPPQVYIAPPVITFGFRP
jgi:hypothetical protein